MSFWKVKKTETATKEKIVHSSERDIYLQQRVEALENVLQSVRGTERIDCLNQLGELYSSMKNIDAAIKYYELSLQENRVFGKACTGLMTLYNIKRKDAAMARDDVEIQLYLDKLDDLMAINKSIMRSNIS